MNDLKSLQEQINAKQNEWQAMGISRTPWNSEKRTPRRGNRVSEHNRRIVAAIELLKSAHYSEPDALSVTSKILSGYGMRRKTDTLRKLCDRYQVAHSSNRPGCRCSPENLPNYWLDGHLANSLGSYIICYCSVETISFREFLKRISTSRIRR